MKSTMKTTVVGSFPVPDWLKACPMEQALVQGRNLFGGGR